MQNKIYLDPGKEIEIQDNVNHPSHYKLKGLEPYESIDIIKASLGEEFKSFCIGNVFKYIIRYKNKNGIEDLKKASVYLNWAIKNMEEKSDTERVLKSDKISG